MHTYSTAAVVLLAGTAAAYPRTPDLFKRQAYSAPGVATFNDYAAQSSTVCGSFQGTGGTYGAAASDISPDISGGACSATINMSECSGTQPVSGYQGPHCPTTNCGTCYKVTNEGGLDGGSIGGVGNSVIVQIIDSCPSESAQNFCKTNVPANERCGDPGTNQLDIDQSAYMALTGQAFGSGPNLKISIAPSSCSGGSTTGGGPAGGASSSSAAAPAATSTTPANNNNNNGGGNNPPPSSTSTPPPAATAEGGNPGTTPGSSSSGQAQLYAQCGGIDNSNNQPWSGPTTCVPPATCQAQNQYYSQCLPGSKMMARRDAIAVKDSVPFFVSEHKKRDAIAVKDSVPFFVSDDRAKREAVIIKDSKPYFLSGES